MHTSRELLDRVGRGGVAAAGRIGYGAAFRLSGRPAHRDAAPDRSQVRAIVRRAASLGAVLVDTADSYGPGLSEELVAEALYPYSPDVLVATKGGVTRLGPDSTRLDGHPDRLRAACEASLRRLRVDAIGLYQLHWADPVVPFADQVGALADLRRTGKIQHAGLCNVSAAELRLAMEIVPIAAVQNRFGLHGTAGAAVADACAALGVAFIAHGCLDVVRAPASAAVLAVGHRLGATSAQVALAWALQRLPNGIVIPGTLRMDHLDDNMEAATLSLSAEDLVVLAQA